MMTEASNAPIRYFIQSGAVFVFCGDSGVGGGIGLSGIAVPGFGEAISPITGLAAGSA